MFKKEESQQNFKEVETIIGPSVKVKGNFNSQGNIIVEGVLEGTLKTAGNVYLGDKAKIQANIEANDIRAGGEIRGNIKAKGYLEIVKSAIITGDVECSQIAIQKGAVIQGRYTMAHDQAQKNENEK